MKRLTALSLLLLSLPLHGAPNWFRNQEQQAAEEHRQGHYDEAAKHFQDPYRRGVAHYRAGDYAAAAKEFSQVERPEVRLDALYNLGNSRYRMDDFKGAVEAYESVLEQNPDHADARFNLALAQKKLAEKTTRQPREKENEPSQKQEPQSGEQQQDPQSPSGDQRQEQEQESASGQPREKPQQGPGESDTESTQADEQERRQEQNAGEQAQQEPSQGKPGSEQAQQGGGDQQGSSTGEERPLSQEGETSREPRQSSQNGGAQRDQQQDRDETDSGETPATPEGPQADEKSANLEKPQDGNAQTETPAGGGEQRDRDRDPAPLPSRDEKANTAVDQVDQSGRETSPPENSESSTGGGGKERLPFNGGQALMEQWLEQIEGDPARLMQQQFRLEEYKYLRDQGGRERETRPW